jgi:dephospho-CoA kinase
MILRAGLTGGIAAGKSSIVRTFAGLGCLTIDADAVVGRLYRAGNAGHDALVRTYGRAILCPDGTIDRVKLADLAFATPEATQQLNALIHPLVHEEQERIVAAETARFPERDRIVVVEATLLLESGARDRYDRIIVVDVDPETQLARGLGRGMQRADLERRIARQMAREDRLRHADYVIDNCGASADAERQACRVYESLLSDLKRKKRTGTL